MATKQFGRLKLHWSKRGLAYKWGDGEIHRLSFGRQSAEADGEQPADGHYPGGQDSPEYGGYGRGYDQGDSYSQDGHGEGYDPGGYSPDEGAPAGRLRRALQERLADVAAARRVCRRLGIWLLWKRDRLEPKPRLIVSGVAAGLVRRAADLDLLRGVRPRRGSDGGRRQHSGA